MAQRGNRGGRKTTRKPVTIDLEAAKEEATMKTSPEAASTENTSTEPATVEPQPAEPVAMENLDADAAASVEGSSETKSPDEAVTKEQADAKPADIVDEAAAESVDASETAAAGTTTIVHKRGISAIGGGVIGGLLTLVGAAGLQSAGMLPGFGAAEAPVQQVAPAVDLTPLEAQIAALQAELETVRAAGGGAEGATSLPDDIQSQLDSAASAVAEANARSETAQAELASVNERLDALQQAISSGEAGESVGLEAIAARIDSLEEQSAQVANAEPAAALDPAAAIAALQPSLDGVNEQVSALSASVEEQVGALNEDVAAISQTLEGITGEVATLQQGLTTVTENQTATSEQVSSLSQQIADNAERLEQSGAGNTVAKAIAASGLKSAADRGLPFMAELETFASAGGDAGALASLRDFAAAGVPTRAQLVEQFAPVANAIVASEQNLDESSSIADRLMNSARSLVQVRDLDEVEGESVTAITNRIEAALKADDLDNALAQWETLPDNAKAVSSAFADQLRARQNVDSLLNDVLTQSMAATAPSADQ